jgi:hypothetical protein
MHHKTINTTFGGNFWDFWIGDESIGLPPVQQSIQGKQNYKICFNTIFKFALPKTLSLKGIKRQTKDWEKIFVVHISNKDFYIYNI